MSLPESPDLSTRWCPSCDPDRDPTREILRVEYCTTHAGLVDPVGVDDPEARKHVGQASMNSAGMAVGSEGNAAACAIIHKDARHASARG